MTTLAFVPAPGTNAFYGYSLYINANSLRDEDGDKVPGVSVDVLAFAPRVLHTWESTLFGWKMASGGLTEPIYADVKVSGAEDDDLGPTLIGLEPLSLSKTVGTWTLFHGPLIYLHWRREGIGVYVRETERRVASACAGSNEGMAIEAALSS